MAARSRAEGSAMGWLLRPLGWILYGALGFALMLLPLSLAALGAWVGTSLAVYYDGPIWLAIVGAVGAFAVLPLLWELWADREQRGGRLRDAVLRSSFLSFALIVGLLATHPEDTFKALATRGDWFLGDAQGQAADNVRDVLFTMADGLEWLNEWVRDKAFREGDQGEEVDPGRVVQWTRGGRGGGGDARRAPFGVRTAKIRGVPIPGSELVWPLPAEVSPAVRTMPEEAKASVATVGAYLAERVDDPFLRVKAVHDFVATWVRYDYEGLDSGSALDWEHQRAEVVFRAHLGVCAGFARLMEALGEAAGVRIIVLAGDARTPKDYEPLRGEELPASDLGHAWNAAEIGGRWYLIDATWDNSGPGRDGSPRRYKTTYLFMPPRAMLLEHLPDAARWQLLDRPLTRGEWLRAPLLDPLAVAYGIDLLTSARPIMSARGQVRFALSNPAHTLLSLGVKPSNQAGPLPICASSHAASATLSCPLTAGRWEAGVFAKLNPNDRGRWILGAQIEVE